MTDDTMQWLTSDDLEYICDRLRDMNEDEMAHKLKEAWHQWQADSRDMFDYLYRLQRGIELMQARSFWQRYQDLQS